MGRIRIALVLSAVLALPLAVRPASAEVVTEDVSFTLTNPLVPGTTYTVRGTLTRPAGCTTSVLLALHGLSYGKWAWDFPLQPATYSTARALAAQGYALLAIDRLGYGSSDHPNGYTLTTESYADMTAQMIRALRSGQYEGGPAFVNVGLMGHSAGAEIVELTAGLYPDLADVLIPGAYQHAIDGVSSEWLLREWIPGDVVRSFESDYEEFEQGYRAQDMYNLSVADGVADPAIVAKDDELANLTPSGEIMTISEQPSRYVIGSITAPVLLVLAAKDALFPSSNAGAELALFSGSSDTTLYVVPLAGHTYPLHKNAPQTNAVIAGWLETRLASC